VPSVEARHSSTPERFENVRDRPAISQRQGLPSSPRMVSGDTLVSGLSQSLPATPREPAVGLSRAVMPSVAVQLSSLAAEQVTSIERVPSIERDPSRTRAQQICDMLQCAVPSTQAVEELIQQRVDKVMETVREMSKHAQERFAQSDASITETLSTLIKVRLEVAELKLRVQDFSSDSRLAQNQMVKQSEERLERSEASVAERLEMSEASVAAQLKVASLELRHDMDGLRSQFKEFADMQVSTTTELRHDIDGLRSRFMEFADMQVSTIASPDRGEVTTLLESLHGEIQDMKKQHLTTLNAIHAQNEQHQQMQAQHEELRQQVSRESPRPPSAAPLRAPRLSSDLSFITMNTNNHTESILDLNNKYEDIWKVVEVCVEQLETEKHERIHAASELTALVHELRQEVFAGD